MRSYNGTAWREAEAGATNHEFSFVIGVSEDPVYAYVKGNQISTDATVRFASQGIGFNSLTINSAFLLGAAAGSAAGSGGTEVQSWGHYLGYPGIGYLSAAWLESCDGCGGVTNATFWGDNGSAANTRNGLYFWVPM